MRIADRLIFDGAQAKPLRGIVGRLFQTPVVEAEGLGLPVLEEEFAVIGALQPLGDDGTDAPAVEPGAVDEGGCGEGFVGHAGKDSADPFILRVPKGPAMPPKMMAVSPKSLIPR